MKSVLEQSSQALILRGVVAIIFALLLIVLPVATLTAGGLSVVLLFGIYALVDGLSTIWGSVRKREGHWILMLLVGLVSVIAGLVVLANPVASGVLVSVLVINIVAIRSIVGGALEIISAYRLREEIDNEWLLGISGFASLAFGLILLSRPGEAVAALLLILPFYLLVSGVMQIALGFKVRSWQGDLAKA